MRILFVTNQMEVGGIETNLVRLTRELTGRGHEVLVAARAGRLSPDVVEAGGRHVDLADAPRSPGSAWRDARLLRSLVRTERPDVIHVFSADSALVVWPVRSGRPPVVGSIMGLHMSPTQPTWSVLLRCWLTSFGVRRLIIMAPAIDAMVQKLPVRRRRLAHLSVVGVDLPEQPSAADVDALRAELGLRPGDHAVMTVGRLEPRKSHDLFVTAAARVLAHRDDVRFFLVGDGNLEAELQAQVDGLGAGHGVRLLGNRDDVVRLLATADVCMRPGVVEGFIGITALEAQAVGTPVVSFETMDVRLAITDGETGLLVPPGDTDALGAAIEGLVDDPAERHRLGEAGRAHVTATYAMPVVVDGLLALYEEVIAAG